MYYITDSGVKCDNSLLLISSEYYFFFEYFTVLNIKIHMNGEIIVHVNASPTINLLLP